MTSCFRGDHELFSKHPCVFAYQEGHLYRNQNMSSLLVPVLRLQGGLWLLLVCSMKRQIQLATAPSLAYGDTSPGPFPHFLPCFEHKSDSFMFPRTRSTLFRWPCPSPVLPTPPAPLWESKSNRAFLSFHTAPHSWAVSIKGRTDREKESQCGEMHSGATVETMQEVMKGTKPRHCKW